MILCEDGIDQTVHLCIGKFCPHVFLLFHRPYIFHLCRNGFLYMA